jgi:hypothetical protein
MPRLMRRSWPRRRDISDWWSSLPHGTLTHGFGLLLGVVLILRAGWKGNDYSLRRFQVRQTTSAEQIGRILYLLLGLFFIVTEIIYFWLGIDWLKVSTKL